MAVIRVSENKNLLAENWFSQIPQIDADFKNVLTDLLQT
jgi:hypothetical protein